MYIFGEFWYFQLNADYSLLKDRSFQLPGSMVKIAKEDMQKCNGNAISSKQKHTTDIFGYSPKWLFSNCLSEKPADLRNVEKEIKYLIPEWYHRLNIIRSIKKDALIKRGCGKVNMN